ncbi:sensor histidine kinase [Gloeobacter violaceus]|uniref:histidine kinase n=1 Tax=Gloeobacter violaceus (strain ATCC 29082 / PCC 7421) TaxID=251221 RepID=Q7NMF2_GLOVI|nr:sensor histidine kinase [Gloeobacter violaceus]BAC88755.1 two-component sensor histidine kinase [Gloeobacter violaceus PCC 7421]
MATRLRTQYQLAFALAALVPVAVLGLVEFALFRRALPEREQAVLDDHLRLADLLASNLRYELNLVLEPVQKAADPRSALTRLRSAEQDGALARLMSTTPLFRHLLLVDGRRRVTASAKPTLWRGRVLPASVFPTTGAAGPVYYSSVFASIYDGAPLAAIAVAYPTFERGALVSLLDLGAIESQVRSQSTADRQIWVVDRTGHTLAHSQGQLALSGAVPTELPPVRQVLKNRRGTARYEQPVDSDRVEQLAAFAPIAGTDWGVVVTSPARAALADPLVGLQRFAAGLLFVAAAAVGFAYWLSERISRPLQQLSEQMQNQALAAPTAQVGPPMPTAPALELQVLIDSFGAMRERIGAEAEANRRLLANLTAEKDKLELVIEAIAEGVLVYDSSGRLRTANRALWSLLDSPPGELAHWRTLRLRDALGEPVAPERTVFERAVREGNLASDLYRLEGSGAQPRVLQITAAPLRTGEGELLGGVAVLRDITAQKESERLREDFVATLTHDLRTPLLAAVQTLGFTLDGQYGPLSDGQQQILLAVIESHRELLGLVESLLTIYRYEAGRMRLRKEPTDLAAFVAQGIEELRPLAQSRNQTLLVEVSGPLPPVPCDRQQLRRVLVNLVDNALKFTPAGGRVHLRLEPFEGAVRVAVRDTGRGIPPEKSVLLFVRFAQAESYATGTGLGLYLCRQVVEAHGGRIWAESEPGLGSTFYFTLPLAEGP